MPNEYITDDELLRMAPGAAQDIQAEAQLSGDVGKARLRVLKELRKAYGAAQKAKTPTVSLRGTPKAVSGFGAKGARTHTQRRQGIEGGAVQDTEDKFKDMERAGEIQLRQAGQAAELQKANQMIVRKEMDYAMFHQLIRNGVDPNMATMQATKTVQVPRRVVELEAETGGAVSARAAFASEQAGLMDEQGRVRTPGLRTDVTHFEAEGDRAGAIHMEQRAIEELGPEVEAAAKPPIPSIILGSQQRMAKGGDDEEFGRVAEKRGLIGQMDAEPTRPGEDVLREDVIQSLDEMPGLDSNKTNLEDIWSVNSDLKNYSFMANLSTPNTAVRIEQLKNSGQFKKMVGEANILELGLGEEKAYAFQKDAMTKAILAMVRSALHAGYLPFQISEAWQGDEALRANFTDDWSETEIADFDIQFEGMLRNQTERYYGLNTTEQTEKKTDKPGVDIVKKGLSRAAQKTQRIQESMGGIVKGTRKGRQ